MRILMLHITLVAVLLAGGLVPVAAQGGQLFPRTVIDASGAAVVIPAYPAQVAVLGTVPALDQIVAADALVTLDPRAEPALALWDGVGVLLLPSLYASAYPAWVESAHTAGVPVVQVGAITSLAAWREWLGQVGQITGRDAVARRAVWRFDLALRVAGWFGAHSTNGAPGVLVLTPEGYTVGQGALLTELIAVAGGVNVAAAAGYDDYRQLDDHLVAELAPEVLLLTPAWGAEGRAAFVANPAYAALPAVQSGRVCLLPFGSTQIARPGAAALILALLLHGAPC